MMWWLVACLTVCCGVLLWDNRSLRRRNRELVEALSDSTDVMTKAAATIDRLMKERAGS